MAEILFSKQYIFQHRLSQYIIFSFAWSVVVFGILYLPYSFIYIISSSLDKPFDSVSLFLNFFILIWETVILIYCAWLSFCVGRALSPHSADLPLKDITEGSWPEVTVLIPTYNVNRQYFTKAIRDAKNCHYPRNRLQILIADNSTDESLINWMKDFAKAEEIDYIHRDSQIGFKAGNLNYALTHCHGKYIILIDKDQRLNPTAISTFIRAMADDEKIAFIQAKFYPTNVNNLILVANDILYQYYYNIVSRGKNARENVLFNGTSGCLRKEALEAVGGFSEETFTEDIDTTVLLLSEGWKGKFLDFYATDALLPEKMRDLFAQMWRWAHGGTAVFRKRYRSVLKSQHLSIKDKIEIILNPASFFIGISIVFVFLGLLAMFWLDIQLLRPEIFINIKIDGFYELNELYGTSIVLASIMSIYSLACFLAILWDQKRTFFEKIYRILLLFPYGILSLIMHFFILSAVFDALIGRNGPDSPKATWNPELPILRDSLIVLGVGIIFLLSAIAAFPMHPNWIFFAFISLGSPFPLIYYLNDIRIDKRKLSTAKEDYS